MDLDASTLQTIYDQAINLLFDIVPKLAGAIIVYLVGKFIIQKLTKGFGIVIEKQADNPSLTKFLMSMVRAFLYVLLFLTIAYIVGINVTSFVALLGAAGLAVGLALQGSLANFAGGVLILMFKPFKVGDVIEGQGHLGTVESIDILYTKLKTFDNRSIIIPNGALSNADIINITSKPTRRVDFEVGVAYGTDLKKTRKVIIDTLSKDERIHKDPAPVAFFKEFGDSSLDISARVWTDAPNYWGVFFDNMENLKEAFEAAEIEIPFPQRDVHHYFPEGNPQSEKNNL
ncbi:mechanosensitive ion channel family protein [Pararhodonellum marinum]|uniref:mechanosensitive ion channel family protein n=1 Tax=Pararhodonellum marinum TaxID=2755358 RepID=UPI001890572A|nr:mechanosensitive ion channel family protein [Pararhodonellum marinum]